LKYDWLEDCLKAGKCLPTDSYVLKPASESELLAHEKQDTLVDSQGVALDSQPPKTSDWMQIIKDGGKMGVVSRARSKASQEKEGMELETEVEVCYCKMFNGSEMSKMLGAKWNQVW
jgi:hypothetical protein